MIAPDPLILTAYIFFACMFAGFGLALSSKNHPKIGGLLMISGGVTFLLLSNYCLYCITPAIQVAP
jgi:VIT1/CCC1 family predicted Fe2+/Mn2+ transporter